MAYIFINSIKIIIQYTLLDYMTEMTEDFIDLNSKQGRSIYREIYGNTSYGHISNPSPKIQMNYPLKEQVCDIRYMFSSFNERNRRFFAGFLGKLLGAKTTANLTGLNRKTIQKGKDEITKQVVLPQNRVRKEGGGRQSKIQEEPQFLSVLETLIEGNIAGDPMTHRKWVGKTLRWCQKALNTNNIKAGLSTIRNGLKKLNFSLKKNKKYVNLRNHPDRDKQFKYINKLKAKFLKDGNPVISVDTKKKELIGNFQNSGRTWSKHPTKVLDHDFLSSAEGRLAPYGIYDLTQNLGYIFCGTSADTPEFAVDAIMWWWNFFGRKIYKNATHLLILADAGGSNGYRPYKWKFDLQNRLVEGFNLQVSVSHYPSGTSKYNPIEHRLFSFISIKWAGKPLTSFNKALYLIRSTTTITGLKVVAVLTHRTYEKGIKISKKDMSLLAITKAKVCPNWNYTIAPRPIQV